MYAGLPHRSADALGHLLNEIRVKGCTPGRRNRVASGRPGCKTGQALFMDLGGNSEAAGGKYFLLGLGQRLKTGWGIDRNSPVGARVWAKAVAKTVFLLV